METKNRKTRKLIGVVVSDKMAKTRVVAVSRFKKHPKYLKYYKTVRRLKAHDEGNRFRRGDTVVIEETRPLSREKRWRIVEKVGGTEGDRAS
ncbi:30S ribosomal protein S17 [Candidatus Parcubacteria bacterium]|nr:MAG: 30S ribosomal protein S17 [Candidatus Parcubacteria bacterium]